MKSSSLGRLRVAAVVAAGICLLAAAAPAAAARKAKDYALIAGTVWSPSDFPVPGVKVKIRPASRKKARWEMTSSGRGEFMQRVPPGPGDYVVWCEPVRLEHGAEFAADPVTVHVYGDEREDTGLHLKAAGKR